MLAGDEMMDIIQSRGRLNVRLAAKSKTVDLNTCNFVEMSMNPSELRIDKNGMEYPHDLKGLYATFEHTYGEYYPLVKVPYQIGDIFYVKEKWTRGCIVGSPNSLYVSQGERSDFIFKAECEKEHISIYDVVWEQPVNMPKEATRIFLHVTNVRAERLQDIITSDYKTPIVCGIEVRAES